MAIKRSSAMSPHGRAGLIAADIEAAVSVVRHFAAASELRELPALSRRIGVPLLGKLELTQAGGSYKIRGAAYALNVRTPAERAKGVITFSTGNFGRAVALVAEALGMSCTVYVSPLVPENKLEALRDAGARVEIFGVSQDEAEAEAKRAAAAQGAIFLSPLTDLDVYRGHGTLAVELESQLRKRGIASGTLVIPMSGGGLLAGVASYCHERLPQLRLVGASMTRGAALFASLLAGRPVQVPEAPTLADSLGGGVGGPDTLTVPIALELLDEACLVSEEDIFDAIRLAARDEDIVCEGAAAVPLAAAARFAKRHAWPTPVIALLTGCNIDPALHRAILADAGARDTCRQRDAESSPPGSSQVSHWLRESRTQS
jgi:threonine dehydratase